MSSSGPSARMPLSPVNAGRQKDVPTSQRAGASLSVMIDRIDAPRTFTVTTTLLRESNLARIYPA